jgi:hypothetical protein
MSREWEHVVVLTRATLRNIPDDGILHSHQREDLISYKYSFTAITEKDQNT